jgi:hypothetical protein
MNQCEGTWIFAKRGKFLADELAQLHSIWNFVCSSNTLRAMNITTMMKCLTGALIFGLGLTNLQASDQTSTAGGAPNSNTPPPATSAGPSLDTSTDQNPYLPWEKGSVKLGGIVTFFSSDVSFGLNNAPGVSISAEHILGLQSTLTSFRVEAMYRPGESRRNQVDFYYASFHRSGDATLSKDLTIDGVTYPIGADVSSVFNFDIIRGTYSYPHPSPSFGYSVARDHRYSLRVVVDPT